jgi:hypothetical protein
MGGHNVKRQLVKRQLWSVQNNSNNSKRWHRWSRGDIFKYFFVSFFVTFYWLNIYFIYCYYNKIMFKISYIIVPTWVATMWKNSLWELSFHCFRTIQRVDTGGLDGKFSTNFSCPFLWLFITLIYNSYSLIIIKLSLKYLIP